MQTKKLFKWKHYQPEMILLTVRWVHQYGPELDKQKKAASAEVICSIVDQMTDTLKELRDKAIHLIGFAGALRRSEIAALNVEDLEYQDSSMTIYIPKTKTDQNGEGRA